MLESLNPQRSVHRARVRGTIWSCVAQKEETLDPNIIQEPETEQNF